MLVGVEDKRVRILWWPAARVVVHPSLLAVHSAPVAARRIPPPPAPHADGILLQRDMYDFKRGVILGGEDERSGNTSAEKMIR